MEDQDLHSRVCAKCGVEFPLTGDHWYPARSRRIGRPDGWQSYCRECWRGVNAENKLRRKLSGV